MLGGMADGELLRRTNSFSCFNMIWDLMLSDF